MPSVAPTRRNRTQRPGWALITGGGSPTPQNYNYFPMWNHTFAVRLDGSMRIAPVATLHHANTPVTVDGYARGAFGVPNRNFTAVMWGGTWGDADVARPINAYVARAGQCHGALPCGMPPLASCKAIKEAFPAAPSGIYRVDSDGDAGPTPPMSVYCDMTTGAGGWTALVNPAGLSLPPTILNMDYTTMRVINNGGSCAITPNTFNANGWQGIHAYACGADTIRLSLEWPNLIGATDLMFIATLQGTTTNTLAVNGEGIPWDAVSNLNGTCTFWNGNSTSTDPAVNACHQTYLNAVPHIGTPGFSGNLTIDLTTGPGGSPNGNYGTGMNIQRLFVR